MHRGAGNEPQGMTIKLVIPLLVFCEIMGLTVVCCGCWTSSSMRLPRRGARLAVVQLLAGLRGCLTANEITRNIVADFS